jgi:tryptophanyl-tRNA synthetase
MEEKTAKKVMLSGIQPSGDLTLGSYLGAIKNWSERAEIFDCYYFMADLHSITVRQNPADLRRRTIEQLAQYIACGLDPCARTHAARLGAQLLHHVRRALAYDAV